MPRAFGARNWTNTLLGLRTCIIGQISARKSPAEFSPCGQDTWYLFTLNPQQPMVLNHSHHQATWNKTSQVVLGSIQGSKRGRKILHNTWKSHEISTLHLGVCSRSVDRRLLFDSLILWYPLLTQCTMCGTLGMKHYHTLKWHNPSSDFQLVTSLPSWNCNDCSKGLVLLRWVYGQTRLATGNCSLAMLRLKSGKNKY